MPAAALILPQFQALTAEFIKYQANVTNEGVADEGSVGGTKRCRRSILHVQASVWATAHTEAGMRRRSYCLGYTAHSHVGEVETGRQKPSIEFALKVSRLFNVTMDQLTKDELEIDDISSPEPEGSAR
jgi:hypothetical protein